MAQIIKPYQRLSLTADKSYLIHLFVFIYYSGIITFVNCLTKMTFTDSHVLSVKS